MLKHVFTEAMLLEYGVKANVLSQHDSNSSLSCKALASWIDSAFYVFDSSRLRIDISIPQVVLEKKSARLYRSAFVGSRY